MQEVNEKAIIERLTELRMQYAGERGKSQFARALGISPSTYSYYEIARVPPIYILLKACEITGADLKWLITGQKSQEQNTAEKDMVDLSTHPSLVRKLRDLLSKSPQSATAVSAFIDLLYEKNDLERNMNQKVTSRQTPPAHKPSFEQTRSLGVHDEDPDLSMAKISLRGKRTERPGWIPVLGRTAAGLVHLWQQSLMPDSDNAVTELDQLVQKHIGQSVLSSSEGNVTVDLQARDLLQQLKNENISLIQIEPGPEQEIVEFVECSDIYNAYPDSFALRIDGDSMAPRIKDNDIVLLSPSVTAKDGQIAVVQVSGQIGVTCKFIRHENAKTHLIPVNEDYQTKIVENEQLLWALAVLCHIRI